MSLNPATGLRDLVKSSQDHPGMSPTPAIASSPEDPVRTSQDLPGLSTRLSRDARELYSPKNKSCVHIGYIPPDSAFISIIMHDLDKYLNVGRITTITSTL